MITKTSGMISRFHQVASLGALIALVSMTAPLHYVTAAGPEVLNLRSTAGFAILSGAGITSTGGGIINGDVGASPIAGSAIGVTCAQVNGTIYAVDASGPACAVIDPARLTTAKGDLTTAYNDARDRTPVPTGPFLNPGGGNIGGLVLVPGLYKFTSTALITGADVTLVGGADDVWIFQIAADLQLGSGISVILAGGAQAKNIFWQVGTSAVLGTSSVFKGTILADQSITMNTSSTIDGRALAFSAGVVFNGTGLALPTSPEIAVQQPVGVNIPDGGSKDFGPVLVGSSTSLIFTITNSGDANLTLTLPITFTGVDAAEFTVTVPPTTPVAPGGSTSFTVRFAPLSAGLKAAALQFGNNDSDENPFDIVLSGSGSAVPFPEIAVEQPVGVNIPDGGSKDFGTVLVGGSTSLIFTITNSGTANLTLTLPITFTGVDAAEFTVTVPPTTPVAPGGSTTFTVRFAPLSAGLKAAALQFGNNDSDENPFDIVLSGSGSAVPFPEIAVEQPVGVNIPDGGSKDFGAVLVGGSTSLIFTITNSGTANLTLTLPITFSGVDASQFTVTAPPTTPVLPGGSTTFTVRFAPLTSGVKAAALQIVNNDANENPFDIILTGTGTVGGIIPSLNVFVVAISPIILNPQTGLFEQTVRLANNGLVSVPAVRLVIENLPIDVQVYNASGTVGGVPFVQHNVALAPAATVDLVIEYYRPSRLAIPQPTFIAEETAVIVPVAAGTILPIDRNLQLVSGRFLIEFTTTPGRSYAVQYSSDLVIWKTATPSITAPGNRVQWYDDGPPKTESKPTAGSRFYRIVELP